MCYNGSRIKLRSVDLPEGVMALQEQRVLNYYRRREISLEQAAELLSVDLWTMIEKLKKADIHLDYTFEELYEDFSKGRV